MTASDHTLNCLEISCTNGGIHTCSKCYQRSGIKPRQVQFAPVEVFAQHSKPKYRAFHEEWFACPETFNADLDAVLISQQAMECPNKLGDVGIPR